MWTLLWILIGIALAIMVITVAGICWAAGEADRQVAEAYQRSYEEGLSPEMKDEDVSLRCSHVWLLEDEGGGSRKGAKAQSNSPDEGEKGNFKPKQ